MLAGRAGYSIEAGLATRKSVPLEYLDLEPLGLRNYIQYIYMTPVLVDVRFGRWEEILKSEAPGVNHVYAAVLYHFGRGMAYSALHQIDKAEQELANLQGLLVDSILFAPFAPFSSAIDGARVAENMLKGSIFLEKKNYNDAITAFEKAVAIEEQMVYNEPRDWMLSPGHWLGNAFIMAKRPIDAEKVFKMDLSKNNENLWSLKGLQTALSLQKKAEQSSIKARLQKASSNADIKITGSVIN